MNAANDFAPNVLSGQVSCLAAFGAAIGTPNHVTGANSRRAFSFLTHRFYGRRCCSRQPRPAAVAQFGVLRQPAFQLSPLHLHIRPARCLPADGVADHPLHTASA